jgi:PhnB protein
MKIPEHYSPVMPYISLASDAEGFIEFLTNVFAASEILRVNDEDGTLLHAEYSIGGGTVMFGLARGVWKACPCGIFVVTDDVNAMYQRALDNGAVSLHEPGDYGYGNAAGFQDEWGNQWWPNTPSE